MFFINGIPVAYFWETVLQPVTWLRVFHSFVYEEKQDKVDAQSKAYTRKTLIFPRYQPQTPFNGLQSVFADSFPDG
ncbi:MAG: hypothetical protein WCG16_07160 [Methylococcales bacterium]